MKGTILHTSATLLAAALIGVAQAASAQTALSACGALTKGSYKLTKNLTTTGSCLTVVNNFVTIDLNGFAITGDGGATDFGIKTGAVANLTGIEIRNGTITNFDTAINLPATSGVLVERVRALRNTGKGIWLGTYCVVRDNVAADNGSTGIDLDQGCVATANSASKNGGHGLQVDVGTIASDNAARDNTVSGIRAFAGSTLVNNNTRANISNGIDVNCPSNVVGNTATINGAANIVFNGPGCGNFFNVAP